MMFGNEHDGRNGCSSVHADGADYDGAVFGDADCCRCVRVIRCKQNSFQYAVVLSVLPFFSGGAQRERNLSRLRVGNH